MENEIYKEDNKKSKAGRIINICLTVALFTFIIAFMFRLCQADHKELKDLVITENLKDAYKISTDVRTHVAGSEFSENGALYAYSFVYIPEAKYMQITVRYNDRHINEVIASLNENETVLNGENAKTYTKEDIKIYYTLTDSKELEYSVNLLETEEKYNYYYFKLEVVNVSFEDVSLYVNMMIENTEQKEITANGVTKNTLVYKEGSIYNAGKLEFHNKENKYIPYDFSKNELKEITKE
ncbi:MAG: hypothetical protein IKA02_05590 [Clostridia bacterium]|nr:hypothetical protein [Clostridia bacterium]